MTFNIPPKSALSFFRLAQVACMLILLSACEVEAVQDTPDRNFTLTWSDEFEGEAGDAPDPTKWNYDLGRGDNGWGNRELQSYTDLPENVSLDGEGNLRITAIRNGDAFTSARINTQGLFEQQYGRFEARLKTPYGPGLWPAFWMLGSNFGEVSWPQCGEIDQMELRGQLPSTIAGSLHGPGYSAGAAITSNFALENGRFDTDFHIFAVEWGPEYIDYFVDDFLFQRITPGDLPEEDSEWVFDQPFFMILNVAVGGDYVGFPTSQTPFPQQMIVDYVRVYTEASR